MHSDGRRWSVKLANSATTERSDIYEGAGIGCALTATKERFLIAWVLDKNHRILRRPRTFVVAVERSATQGLEKRRCYVFVYSHIGSLGGCGAARYKIDVVGIGNPCSLTQHVTHDGGGLEHGNPEPRTY